MQRHGSGPRAIGQRIRQCRGELSLKVFARQLGVSAVTVWRWEKGQLPKLVMLERIALLGKKSLVWILTGKEKLPRKELAELREELPLPPLVGFPPAVAEAPEHYGGLNPSDRQIMCEVQELLQKSGTDVKRHLRNQVRLLRRIVRSSKRSSDQM